MKDNGSNRVDQIKQRRRNTPIDKGNQADYGEDCSTDGTLTDAIQQTAWHRQRCAMGTLKDEDENLLENKLGLVQLFQYHAEGSERRVVISLVHTCAHACTHALYRSAGTKGCV